jgi:hypothetical protein
MDLSRGGVIVSVGVAIGIVLIGDFGFGEATTPRQSAGSRSGS